MSVPYINFHAFARTATGVTTIVRGVSRRVAARPVSPVAPVTRQPPPLPGSAAGAPLLRFSGMRGKVIGLRVTNKAFTSSGGGGGYIQQGTGYVAPVWTSTTHVRRTEFWLQNPKTGQENSFWFEGHDEVVLRDGQDVSILFANGVMTYARNHTSGQTHPLATVEQITPLVPAGMGRALQLVIVFAVGSFSYMPCALVAVVLISLFDLITGTSRNSDSLASAAGGLGMLGAVAACIFTAYILFRRERRTAQTNSDILARAQAELHDACHRYLAA